MHLHFKFGKTNKKSTIRPRLYIAGIVAVVIIVSAAVLYSMFTHKPKAYQPLTMPPTGEVTPYLTHYLAPNFYNNIQLDKPLEVIIAQHGLNEIIVNEDLLGFRWPVALNGVTFEAPAIVFYNNQILLMGTITYADFPMVVTIITQPEITPDGLLLLNLRKVRAGRINITYFAERLAERIITAQLETETGGPNEHWLRGLLGALLNNEPFEPVFPTDSENKHIRLTKAEISTGKAVLAFKPE